jgi:hypothetical protein
MTFSADILNAIAGMFHAYQSLGNPISHFLGIQYPEGAERLYFWGLSLDQISNGISQHLMRRKEFPTWSGVDGTEGCYSNEN